MTKHKFLLVPDLHYCTNLAAEVAAMQPQLPADEYDHMRGGRLFWHNELLIEEMETMLTAVVALAAQEQPDLVIFLGDLVNTNWPENVTRLAAQLGAFDCPLTMVTGNHDMYLSDPAARLQEAITPGDFNTGVRHQLWDDVGLIFLDLFVEHENGAYHKGLKPQTGAVNFTYRPEDVAAALQVLDDYPQTSFLLCGHFPILEPDARLLQPGRKIGRNWPSGQLLAQRLAQPNNLLGMVCGHQHFSHLQKLAHGFHWTLPALVEYPCAVALLEVAQMQVRGRLIQPEPTLAARSLQALNQHWTGGTRADQEM